MSNLMSDIEQQELALSFVAESREMLEEVEPLLIDLEKNSDQCGDVDPETVNTIFRLFHSLKGGAGFLGFSTVGKVTHNAETLLDLFRKGVSKISSDHVDLLIKTCDFILHLTNNIEDNLDDAGFDDEADAIIMDLQEAISKIKPEKQAKSKKKNAAPKAAQKAVDEVNDSSAEVPSIKDELASLISPEMLQQFTTESSEQLEKAEQALLELEKDGNNEENISQAFRALHSFKGNAGSFGYNDLNNLSYHMESLLDLVRGGEIKGDGELFSLLLEALDSLRDALTSLENSGNGQIVGIQGWISLLQDSISERGGVIEADSTTQKMSEGAAEPEAVAVEANDELAVEDSVTIPQEAPVADAVAVNPAEAAARNERRAGKDRRQGDRRASSQTVRVDVEKLDKLLDLVGELVISEAMVAQNPDLKDLNIPMDRFERSVMQLEKITRSLQDIATSIRMIPLEGTFKRMIRLVRDLSHKAGKKVELALVGEATEVDKTVIEQLNDPLVHIIRNAIGHGLETPDDRQEAGKTETGTVTLEAKYVGGEVWITVNDDGRGLNRERILGTAIERGLVDGDGRDLNNEEVWQLIFQPGFSTADEITDVSGRGVGMDVVKRNIEHIRGRVDVTSVSGKGSNFVLRIPLTLAIIDGMLVRVGKTRYTLPLVAIKESQKPAMQDVTLMPDGQEILKIRGQLLPVIRIHELFNVEPEFTSLDEGIIIVVENRTETVCLFVDEQLEQQQIVIRGLSNYVGNIPSVSGCTILGNGEISLIIDIAGIIGMADGSIGGGYQNAGEMSTRFDEVIASLPA
ncbi:chemotaxis protein CheA [bacterium]|nr:chemotaxis protein CheA [bacterium]